MTTKRCNKCQLVKSTSEFSKNKYVPDGLSYTCKHCHRKRHAEDRQRGLEILQCLAVDKGCCAHCERPYLNEDWHFFEFDHIDSRCKQSKKETNAEWVSRHTQEFFERVKPNLQLLCIKCHRLKTSEENSFGGAVHQKLHGQSQPAEVIDFGWNLFNPTPTPDADDYVSWAWSLVRREGDWIVQRDIDGRIIKSELAK